MSQNAAQKAREIFDQELNQATQTVLERWRQLHTNNDNLSRVQRLKQMFLFRVLKGGPGSGNWGHAGRPGRVGGSAPTSGIGAAMSIRTGPTAAERQAEAIWQAQLPEEPIIPLSDYVDTSMLAGYAVEYFANATLDLIDTVHADGDLSVHMEVNDDMMAVGRYTPVGQGIEINSWGNHPMMTTAHEIGHALDNRALKADTGPGTSLGFASKEIFRTPAMSKVMNKLESSAPIKKLDKLSSGLESRKAPPSGKYDVYKTDTKYVKYLLSPEEQFARAYAQYVATRGKGGNVMTMRQELDNLRERDRKYPTQWSDKEFEPIAQAFDELFEQEGWMVEG